MCNVLIIDDDTRTCNLIEKTLLNKKIKNEKDNILCLSSLSKINSYLQKNIPEVIIVDIDLDNTKLYLNLIENNVFEKTIVICMTNQEITSELRADLLDKGAMYVIQKPFSYRMIWSMVRRANSFIHKKHISNLKRRASTHKLLITMHESRKKLRKAYGIQSA